ncbi:MAG: hypothetical protein EA402_02560 [Planctomycetota bacterium]|nr:MAG: hypothetical protein EA402_02560 [Planctomycetota bacterium]
MSMFQKPSRLCPLGLLLGALLAWAGWVSAAEGGGTGANEGDQSVIVDLDALVLSAASRQDAVAWRNLRRADSLIMVDVRICGQAKSPASIWPSVPWGQVPA